MGDKTGGDEILFKFSIMELGEFGRKLMGSWLQSS